MALEVLTTKSFDREAKRLAKRYRSFADDLLIFTESLKINPMQGIELFPNVRKVRMPISSKGRGKSGGARVITVNALVSEKDGTVYLLLLYDKEDASSVDKNILKQIVKDSGLLDINKNNK